MILESSNMQLYADDSDLKDRYKMSLLGSKKE